LTHRAYAEDEEQHPQRDSKDREQACGGEERAETEFEKGYGWRLLAIYGGRHGTFLAFLGLGSGALDDGVRQTALTTVNPTRPADARSPSLSTQANHRLI
jgi:hypothetical protein